MPAPLRLSSIPLKGGAPLDDRRAKSKGQGRFSAPKGAGQPCGRRRAEALPAATARIGKAPFAPPNRAKVTRVTP